MLDKACIGVFNSNPLMETIWRKCHASPNIPDCLKIILWVSQSLANTEAKQGWAGQYPDGRPPGKTRLLLEEVLVRPAGGALPVVCVGPNAPV